MTRLERLFNKMVEEQAADLLLTAQHKPQLRIHGDFESVADEAVLTSEDIKEMSYSILTEKQRGD